MSDTVNLVLKYVDLLKVLLNSSLVNLRVINAMHLIESTLFNSVSQYPDMPLVIAYSGGVDSQVLLHALAILNKKNEF